MVGICRISPEFARGIYFQPAFDRFAGSGLILVPPPPLPAN